MDFDGRVAIVGAQVFERGSVRLQDGMQTTKPVVLHTAPTYALTWGDAVEYPNFTAYSPIPNRLICARVVDCDSTSRAKSAGCSGPPLGGSAEPITLRDMRPAYGSNSWLPRHQLASPLIFDP